MTTNMTVYYTKMRHKYRASVYFIHEIDIEACKLIDRSFIVVINGYETVITQYYIQVYGVVHE